MAKEKILNARDTKLVQWLGEAHAKEAELEADLTAHIALTEKQAYKKRLRKHLTETKDHKRRVASRIKKLGGTPGSGMPGSSLPGVPPAVGEVAGKAVAVVKGQVGTARAAVTGQAETHLRNAQEELREEHVEIAIYNRIEIFATEVGDRETAQLAKAIRRDEERMAKFLDAELKRLVKDVVRAEVPRDQRGGTTRSTRARATPSRSTRARATPSRSTRARATPTRTTRARATPTRSTRARASAAGSNSGNSSSGGSSSSSGSSSARSRSGGSRGSSS